MAGFEKPNDSLFARNDEIEKADMVNSVCGKEEGHEWSELPSLPLENIYSFLSRTDQSRMSQVCRRWNREYGSPSVWRTIKFVLPEHICSSDVYPEVQFAQKYSSMCRNVEIVCRRVRSHMRDEIWRQLKMFLEILTENSRLVSLKLWNMAWYFRQLDDSLYDPLFQSIVDLLSSQSSLKTVEFHDCRFSFYESVEVLKSLSEKNSDSLQNLTLRGFVEDLDFDHAPDEKALAILDTILRDRLCNLKNLSMDYTQMFECLFPRVLDAQTTSLWNPKLTNKKRLLSNLTLFCKGRKLPVLRGFPPFFWKHMKEWFPDLTVQVYFDPSSNPLRELEFFVPRFIPLRYMDFGLYKPYNASVEPDLDAVLRHFLATDCTKHLETLFIVWLLPIPNLASVIKPFFRECQKLKSFQLYTLCPLGGLEETLKGLLDSRPFSLQDILVSVARVRDEEQADALFLVADEYCPLLQVSGLDTHIVIEPTY